MRSGAALICGLLALAVPRPVAAGDASPPALRLNSPFAATLWQLGVDASETYLVSASAYKAITVWPLPEPGARKTLRLPLRAEQRKRAHGAAISPDGGLIAASVPPLADDAGLPLSGTARIHVLERRSGRRAALLDGLASRAQALAFSPDGAYLAAVLSDGCGLRLWRAGDWKLIYRDDAGHGGAGDGAAHCAGSGGAAPVDALPDTTGLAFARAGTGLRLVTSGDTGLRTYQVEAGGVRRLHWRRPPDLGLERPGDVAFSPDGTRLVVAERRDRTRPGPVHLRVQRFSFDNLEPIGAPLAVLPEHLRHPGFLDPKQNRDILQASLAQLAWVHSEDDDEDWIFAGGVFWCAFAAPERLLTEPRGPADICLVRFSPRDGDAGPGFIPAGSDRIMDLVPLPKRGGLVYAGQGEIGAIGFDGAPLELPGGELLLARGRAADFRGGAMAFRISADARQVYFEDYRGRLAGPVRVSFDLARQRLSTGMPPPELLEPDHDPNLITGWRNNPGSPLILDEPFQEAQKVVDDVTRAAAIIADKQLVLLGSSDFLRLVSFADGAPRLLCRRRITHEAYRVNITPDAKIAVVGHSDGTLRWYRIDRAGQGCEFRQALAVHLNMDPLGNWIWTAWLPSGQFANDPRARRQIGWQLERQPGKVSYVPYHKLLRLYDRKAVASALDKAVEPGKPVEPDRAAARERGLTPVLYRADDALGKAARGLTVLGPAEMSGISDNIVRFSLEIGDLERWPARLQIRSGSGVLLEKRIGGQRLGAETPIMLDQKMRLDLGVVLPDVLRRSRRAVHICFELNGKRNRCHALVWKGDLAPPKPRRLWAVIIGVSKHKFSSYDLPFTQNDALDLAQIFVDDYERRALGGGAKVKSDFSEVHIDLVVSPSSASAREQLKSLTSKPYVTGHPATRQGILQALNRLVERDRHEELSNDLFLFHFSGHGFIHPYNREAGRSAFVTYATDPELARAEMDSYVLTSADLIKALEQISAEKLVIIDACRVPVRKSDGEAFDPGLVSAEFQDQLLSAHYFFSGQAGQYSLDQADYAFNRARPPSERGNGLFSFALLKALTDRDADLPGPAAGRGRIEVIEVKRYLDRLFDLGDADSLASIISRSRRRRDIQQPVYIPSRRLGQSLGAAGSTVIRTLDPG